MKQSGRIEGFLSLILICLICLSGCMGQTEKTTTVFIGQEQKDGVLQVATDEKILVTVKDSAGKTHLEKRSIGQFFVLPPHQYDEIKAAIEELKQRRKGAPIIEK